MSNIDVDKESVDGPFFNGHTDVGTTAVKLTPVKPARLLRKGVIVRADTGNANSIWLGNSIVTADSVVGTGGYVLAPGDAVFIPLEDHSLLYAISDTTSQDLSWLAI